MLTKIQKIYINKNKQIVKFINRQTDKLINKTKKIMND